MDDKDARRKLEAFDLRSAPGYLLRRNHQRSFEIFTQLVGDDVTRQQIALLVALNRRPGASQRDLVEATGIDKSTLKEMLNRMVARGWIDRERDRKDSRAWTMQITASGRELLLDRIDRVEAAQREILAPLSPENQLLFMGFLRDLIRDEETGGHGDQ